MTKPTILFCSSPFSSRKPNEVFEGEYQCVRNLGLQTMLFNEDLLAQGSIADSLRQIPENTGDNEIKAIYRGWMLKEKNYQILYQELQKKGVQLVNSPAEYLNAHYLPNALPWIEKLTPKTVWFSKGTPLPEITLALKETFGHVPLILKDFVKSQKHNWLDACFIPASDSQQDVIRVTSRFLELQEDELVGGLVYREYWPFQKIGVHPESGMPVSKEIRVFAYEGKTISIHPYWDGFDISYPKDVICSLADSVTKDFPSHFFSLDFAQHEDGSWKIVEIGDGQVSEIPDKNYIALYKKVELLDSIN